MIVVLKILWIVILAWLCYQDIKERKISLLMLITGILLGGAIHYFYQQPIVWLSNIAANCAFVGVVFGILGLYAKFKMKRPIFEVFGQGDLVFFIVLAVSLPILSFLMVFVFSTIFSLLIFMLLKQKLGAETVPLAGLQSVFLALVCMVDMVAPSLKLYAL